MRGLGGGGGGGGRSGLLLKISVGGLPGERGGGEKGSGVSTREEFWVGGEAPFTVKKDTGPNFIHPHPPTPKNTLLGVGGV